MGSANASPLLRAFQPVTCRFSMLLWLGEESPRPPLPKADPKHSRMRKALSAAGRRGARGGTLVEPFASPRSCRRKSFHLAKGMNFNMTLCFQGCHLTVVQKGGDIPIKYRLVPH